MTTHDPSAGSAALAFLDSGHRPPEALPAADPARLPPVHKRYPSAVRVPLPPGGAPADDTGPALLSRLLRHTNGITRMRWMSGLMPLGLGGAGAPGDRRVLLSPGVRRRRRAPAIPWRSTSPTAGRPVRPAGSPTTTRCTTCWNACGTVTGGPASSRRSGPRRPGTPNRCCC